MITGCQLALCLGKVERTTVGLGITCHEEHEEGDDGGNMTTEDEPVPRTGLCLHDTRHLHRACEDDGCDKAEAERHLIRDHLHGATQCRHNGILVVGTPSGEEHANHSDTGNGGEKEDANIEVEHHSTIVPRQEGERSHRGCNHKHRSEEIEHLVGLIDSEDLLDEHLQHVGEDLEHSPGTYSHRAKTALEVGTHLTLHEYQDDGQHGISQQDAHAHQDALDKNRPEIPEPESVAQEAVNPCSNYTKIKHISCLS